MVIIANSDFVISCVYVNCERNLNDKIDASLLHEVKQEME